MAPWGGDEKLEAAEAEAAEVVGGPLGVEPAPEGCLLPLPAASGLPLFFQGWNPLPTAASASGGGDMDAVLLQSAAIMASGVVWPGWTPRSPGCPGGSCRHQAG